MNINDVKEVKNDGRSYIEQIFERQKALMDKYHEIEIKNGLRLDTNVPVDINSHKGQAVLKDFAWRVIEELAEAGEALEQDDKLHAQEEVSDALHFMTELCILSGIDHKDVANDITDFIGLGESDTFEVEVYSLLLNLGTAMNCLKNKPWKQTQMLTDIVKYQNLIIASYHQFGFIWGSLDMDPNFVYELYFKKNKVNQFRQRSNY